jgi:15-cis-phytoene desaturase
LGGRAQSWTDARTGDAIDLGPHILLTEYSNMLALLDSLGTRDRIAWETKRLIRLRESSRTTDMQLHRLPPPLHLLPSFAKVRSLSWQDKRSNWPMLRLAMCADEQVVRELDEMTAAELLKKLGVTQRFTDWFWATACITVMNVPLEQCSAGALLRVFAQLIGRREYRIGFAACGLAELFAPAASERIAKQGAAIHLKTAVRRLVIDSARIKGIVLADGTHLSVGCCVVAAPPAELHALLPDEWRSASPFNHLRAFEPSPYVSVYLWFDRKVTREKFWAQIWDPTRLNSDFYDLSNIRHGWEHRPSVIASNIIYSHRANALSDAQIIERTVAEIGEAESCAVKARVEHAIVNRIPMAIPCPCPGLEAKRPGSTTAIHGLLLAGDWTRTGLPSCMESAVYSGWSAAEQLWRSLDRPRELVRPVKQVDGFVRLAHRFARCNSVDLLDHSRTSAR